VRQVGHWQKFVTRCTVKKYKTLEIVQTNGVPLECLLISGFLSREGACLQAAPQVDSDEIQ